MDEMQNQHIVRVGWFNGDFLSSIRQFRNDFVALPDTNPRVDKFIAYEDGQKEYLVVACLENGREFSEGDYNIALIISSENQDYNDDILSDFEEKTGITGLRGLESKTRYSVEEFADMISIFREVPDADVKKTLSYFIS